MPPESRGLRIEIDLTPDQLDELVEAVVERIGSGGGQTPALLDSDEAAEYLRCDKQRLYNLKAEGRITYVKDGSRLLFRRTDLDAYLAESTAKATGEPNRRTRRTVST